MSVVTVRKNIVDLWTFRDHRRSDAKAYKLPIFLLSFFATITGYQIHDYLDLLPPFINYPLERKHFCCPVCLTNPHIS